MLPFFKLLQLHLDILYHLHHTRTRLLLCLLLLLLFLLQLILQCLEPLLMFGMRLEVVRCCERRHELPLRLLELLKLLEQLGLL